MNKKTLDEKCEDIKIEDVGPNFEDAIRYATTKEGYIDLRKLQQLEGRYGGRCDVKSGPCSCGAWH